MNFYWFPCINYGGLVFLVRHLHLVASVLLVEPVTLVRVHRGVNCLIYIVDVLNCVHACMMFNFIKLHVYADLSFLHLFVAGVVLLNRLDVVANGLI